MPAKVIEPEGKQSGANPNAKIGYLLRADALDGNGDLKRIPFINDRGLEKEDLVIFDINCDDYVVTNQKTGQHAHIAVAEIPDEFFSPKGWSRGFTKRWRDEWIAISEDNLNKLKPKFRREYIDKIKNIVQIQPKRAGTKDDC